MNNSQNYQRDLLQLQSNGSVDQQSLVRALQIMQNIYKERDANKRHEREKYIHQSYNVGQQLHALNHQRSLPDRSNLIGIGNSAQPIVPLPFTFMPFQNQIQIGFDYGNKQDAPFNINNSQQLQHYWLRDKSILDPNRLPPAYFQSDFEKKHIKKIREIKPTQSLPSIYQQQSNMNMMYQQPNMMMQQQQPNMMMQQQQPNRMMMQQQPNMMQQQQQMFMQKQMQMQQQMQMQGAYQQPDEQQVQKKKKKKDVVSKKKVEEIKKKHEEKIRKEYEDKLQEKNRKQKVFRKIGKREIRIIAIRFYFLAMFLETLRYYVKIIKLKQLKRLEEMTEPAFESVYDALEECTEPALLKILNLTDDLVIEIGKDQGTNKKIQFIQDISLQFLQIIDETLTPANLGREFFLFLLNIASNYQFPPKNYFLAFEIERLHFTNFGALKKVTPEQQNMMIIMLILVRNLIFLVILKAWKYHPDQQNTDKLFLIQRNALLISSVLHHIIVQLYEPLVPLVEFDWANVPEEDRAYAIPYLREDNEKQITLQYQTSHLVEDALPITRSKRYVDLIEKKKLEQIKKLIYDYGEKIRKGLLIVEKEERVVQDRMIQKMEFLIDTRQKYAKKSYR